MPLGRRQAGAAALAEAALLSTGCVSCLEYDEHYILTFPNGYGRQVDCFHQLHPVSLLIALSPENL